MNKLPFENIERKLIYKQKARITKPKKKNGEQLLNFGIINLDKPKGPKSIHVVNKLRHILQQPKIGHGGTLDPAVTGVLPIATGPATRVLHLFSLAGKVYEGKLHLHGNVSEEEIKKVCKQFVGKIKQIPPKRSAVKREEREREVYWFDIKKIDYRNVHFETGVQHGTYIRNLCVDIGEKLGVGGHMAYLNRLQAGPMRLDESVTLQDIKNNYFKYVKTKESKYIAKFMQQPDKALSYLPAIYVDKNVIPRLKHGSPVFAPGIVAFTSEIKKGDNVAIFDTKSNLLALGIAEMSAKEIKNAKKGLSINTDVVFIK